MRLFQQGHWVEENHVVFVNIYDITTPEQAKKIALAAFQLYLDRYYKGGKALPAKEYTLERHKKTWTWRGGDTRTPETERAWKHFDSEKKAKEESVARFYEALDAFHDGDYEKVLKFLDGFDDIDLVFDITETKDEFVTNPRNDKEEFLCEECGGFHSEHDDCEDEDDDDEDDEEDDEEAE